MPAASFGYCGSRLAAEFPIEQRRKVDAPEPAAAVALERLEQEARRDATGHSGLDDFPGTQVTRQAPNRASKRGGGVVPPTVDAAARGEILLSEQPAYVAPKRVVFGPRGTGPFDSQKGM